MGRYVNEGRKEANYIDKTRVPLVGSSLGLVEAPDNNRRHNQDHYQHAHSMGRSSKREKVRNVLQNRRQPICKQPMIVAAEGVHGERDRHV